MIPEMIDLTLPLRRGMRGFDWETRFTIERDGWNARTLHLYSHAGTHMDAQTHFAAGAETIDQIPLERCAGMPRVVRLPGTQPRELLTPAHLGEIGATIQRGEVLILATGWSRFVDDATTYRDELPRVSVELAYWCVEHGVKLLGVEPPSIADVDNREELTQVHRILLAAGVVVVEGLTNLESLRDGEGLFVAAPLKVEGADGCPCRAFVIR